ncbi:MAG: glycoside hydrolase family 140 protein [Mycobacterium sp.]
MVLVAIGCATVESSAPAPHQWLRASANGHFLVLDNGTPFVIQADSVWWLGERSTREDVIRYLDARRGQGFNTVMFIATFEFGRGRNPYGQKIWDSDASQPNPAFFDHIDFIVAEAEARGMHAAIAPAWVKHVTPPRGDGLTVHNAYGFGQWVGRRYRDRPIIWIMGGDDDNWHVPIVNEVARGITNGVTGSDTGHDGVVITYHPGWAQSSAARFHDEDWLDFNMAQSGHCGRTLTAGHRLTTVDFERRPPKPTMDGESFYAGHPLCMDPSQPYSTAQQVRNGIYNGVFGGGAGIAYGHHSVWQMYQPGRKGVNGPVKYWYDALSEKAATQVVHLRRLLQSRPIFTRTPDGGTGTAEAGTRTTTAEDGAYMMVYSADGRPVSVDLNRLSGATARLWWYDPRSGTAIDATTVPSAGEITMTPPEAGDWVLVVDDTAHGFPAPGAHFDQPTDFG